MRLDSDTENVPPDLAFSDEERSLDIEDTEVPTMTRESILEEIGENSSYCGWHVVIGNNIDFLLYEDLKVKLLRQYWTSLRILAGHMNSIA